MARHFGASSNTAVNEWDLDIIQPFDHHQDIDISRSVTTLGYEDLPDFSVSLSCGGGMCLRKEQKLWLSTSGYPPPFSEASTTTRIAPSVGAKLLGQHSAERNQEATVYVGNLDTKSERMDHLKMETCIDFLQCLEADMSLSILSCLVDPADLVRAGAVSRFWHQFVIANGLTKQLCLKMYPQLSNIVSIDKMNDGTIRSADYEYNGDMEWKILERDHKVYASLCQALTKSNLSPMDCIENAIWASSTHNYPDESVVNTLNPKDRFFGRASYWSSTGQNDPDVPETLIYKLRDGIWLVTEIDIQPFEAFFQPGKPIYSAKYVRFRISHTKSPREIESNLKHLPMQKPSDDMFRWTYTSPEFPMTQENCLQPFKLPEPVLCTGGYLQIELLGRVERHETDGLFYICVCHVRVLGRPLYPAFHVEILEPHENFMLKYIPEALSSVLKSFSSDEIPLLRQLEDKMKWERVSLLENLL
ncbi:F-box protein [Abeliophyllum distichum]|uniref:F-box protein n=1 Tax=Abeliophyllum distichum TaxID=126358 RepID=A0ABD1RBH1_9LAMI